MDYPKNGDVFRMIGEVKAKTVSDDFTEQLELSEKYYGCNLKFHFGEKEIRELCEADTVYEDWQKERVFTVICQQKRKYPYLFM